MSTILKVTQWYTRIVLNCHLKTLNGYIQLSLSLITKIIIKRAKQRAAQTVKYVKPHLARIAKRMEFELSCGNRYRTTSSRLNLSANSPRLLSDLMICNKNERYPACTAITKLRQQLNCNQNILQVCLLKGLNSPPQSLRGREFPLLPFYFTLESRAL